jgi:ABC-2 type transport system permease protein
MSRLLRVELTRILCRRAVLVLLAAALVIPAIIGVARVLNTQEPSAAEIAQAEEMVQTELESRWVKRELAKCTDDPDEYFGGDVPSGDLEQACRDWIGVSVDNYLYVERLELAAERDEGSGFAVVIVLAILMMLAGTTFAGHDWASGSVSNQLLFEPRRPLVWAAKGAVVTALAGLFAGVVVTAYWLLLGLIARSRGIPIGDGLLLDCLQSGWRGAGVAAGSALAGYALTMLFRSTVAALGVLLAASVAGGIVLAVIGVGSVWNPGLNIAAIILDGATYWAEAPCPGGDAGGGFCEVEKTLPLGRAVWFLGTGLVLFAGASVASFHRRDVP